MTRPTPARGRRRGLHELLTPRQIEVLTIMAAHPDENEGELVYERGRGYLGDDPVSGRTLFALLRLTAISLRSGEVGGVERYEINETGRTLLAAARRGGGRA